MKKILFIIIFLLIIGCDDPKDDLLVTTVHEVSLAPSSPQGQVILEQEQLMAVFSLKSIGSPLNIISLTIKLHGSINAMNIIKEGNNLLKILTEDGQVSYARFSLYQDELVLYLSPELYIPIHQSKNILIYLDTKNYTNLMWENNDFLYLELVKIEWYNNYNQFKSDLINLFSDLVNYYFPSNQYNTNYSPLTIPNNDLFVKLSSKTPLIGNIEETEQLMGIFEMSTQRKKYKISSLTFSIRGNGTYHITDLNNFKIKIANQLYNSIINNNKVTINFLNPIEVGWQFTLPIEVYLDTSPTDGLNWQKQEKIQIFLDFVKMISGKKIIFNIMGTLLTY